MTISLHRSAITAVLSVLLLFGAASSSIATDAASDGAWLQPKGHTSATFKAAYKDQTLNKDDPIYYVGDRVVERWKRAPLRADAVGKKHGYRAGFVDIEVLIVEQNAAVTKLAVGKLPSEYGDDILDLTLSGSGKITRAPCDSVVIRFSEAGWLPPGMYPVRDYTGEHVGNAEMIVYKTYPQVIVPVFDGVMALIVPTYPLVHQRKTGQNPTLSIAVYEGDEQVPLKFLPAGVTDNRIRSTPENSARAKKNDLRLAAKRGGRTFVMIVPPGVCS